MADKQQLTVTATHADSSTEDVTGDSTFESSATGVATVSAAGLIQAVAVGSTTITATYQSKTATCAVTVTNPVASIAVDPTSAPLTLA